MYTGKTSYLSDPDIKARLPVKSPEQSECEDKQVVAEPGTTSPYINDKEHPAYIAIHSKDAKEKSHLYRRAFD